MAFTGLATKNYKDPLTVQWANSIKDNFDYFANSVVQVTATILTSVVTDSNFIPWTVTGIINTQGTEAMTATITPTFTANTLLVRAVMRINGGTADNCTVALFRDTVTTAIATVSENVDAGAATIVLETRVLANTAGATSFKIRFGQPGNTTYTNAIAAGTPIHGGAETCILTVAEIKV